MGSAYLSTASNLSNYMPVGHARFESTRGDYFVGDEVDRFSMPLFRLFRTRICLSYSVLVALAVLVGVVVNVSRQPGNSDLPRVALFATIGWVSGWLVQLLVYGGVAYSSGVRLDHLTVGVLGVESVPRRWSGRIAFLASLSAVMGVVFLGCFYRLVDGGFQVPTIEYTTDPIWQLSSIGLGEVSSVWRTASWLCFIQVIGQMCSLPRTLGRQMLASSVSIFGRKLGVVSQVRLFRLALDSMAFCTLGFAIWLMTAQQDVSGAGWPLFMGIAVLLWLSSRHSDTLRMLEAMDFTGQTADASQSNRFWSSVAERLRCWRDVRRVRRAHRMEQGEAVDAQRVDEILNRLHSEGIGALNGEDRRLLERVSENLRKQRQAESDEMDATS